VRQELHQIRRESVSTRLVPMGGYEMKSIFRKLWREEQGQDIAEYAVMLAVILVIVVGTIRLIGSNANNVFSSVASSVQ
jgi:Flp pilus assembly pilin Flp